MGAVHWATCARTSPIQHGVRRFQADDGNRFPVLSISSNIVSRFSFESTFTVSSSNTTSRVNYPALNITVINVVDIIMLDKPRIILRGL